MDEQYRQNQLGHAQWVARDPAAEASREPCPPGDHSWAAAFFQSGSLAYWRCERCGTSDRGIDSLPQRLESISHWPDAVPRLVASGPTPPRGSRKWATAEGAVLEEGDHSAIHFRGVAIPGLSEAHSYVERDGNQTVLVRFEPSRKRLGQYSDHYMLTRYLVVGDKLVEFVSHCFEDSTYELPNTSEPKRTIIRAGLRRLLD